MADRERQLRQVEILRLDVEGDGIAVIAGTELRVPYVLPGERVEVRTAAGTAERRSRSANPPSGRRPGYREAELVRVLTPSRHRVAALCRHFGPCGGCAWQHIAYPEQLRLKQEQLQRLLDDSLGPRAPKVLETLATPGSTGGSSTRPELGGSLGAGTPAPPWAYRNKAHFVLGPGTGGRSLEMGHYRRRSRTVIPVVECPVHAEEGNRVAFGMRDVLLRARVPGTAGDASEGVARHLVVRAVEDRPEWLATLVVTENVKALRRVTADFVRGREGERGRWGLFLNVHPRPGPYLFGRETRHLAGARDVREEVAGISYVISPTSFFQTNVRAARVLAAEVLDALADPAYARVLDLYAGVGLFALPLARGGREVAAVEGNREAMAAASAGARENGIPDNTFRPLASPVESVLDRLTPRPNERGGRVSRAWDAVVVDPPREGCPPIVLDWLFNTLRPRRIVYVSCNPEALARDLRLAPADRYAITRVQPLDMFPHTAHIETVAVLDRK